MEMKLGMTNKLAEIIQEIGLVSTEDGDYLAEELAIRGVIAPVRCQDCRFCQPLPEGKKPLFESDIYMCDQCRGDDCYGISAVLPYDFCSSYERR